MPEISFINISTVARGQWEIQFRIERTLVPISFYVPEFLNKTNVQNEMALNNIFRVNFKRKNAIFRTKPRAMGDECKYSTLGTAFVRKMAPLHTRLPRKILFKIVVPRVPLNLFRLSR